MKTLILKVAQDRLERIANIAPIRAIEELIWNSLDADATDVSVSFTQNAMSGIENISVSDNGHGIDYDTAEFAFGSLGGSKKQAKAKSPTGRLYHGKEGEGRYKSFRLGRNILWKSRFRSKSKEIQKLNIQVYAATRDKSELSDLQKSNDDGTGVEVISSSIADGCNSLLDDKASDYLTIQLASYLFGYNKIRIDYDGKKVNPNEILADKVEIPLSEDSGGTLVEAELLICEWKKGKHTGLFLCNNDGVVIHKTDYTGCSDFSYSAYLKSSIFAELDKDDLLCLEDLHPNVAILKNSAQDEIRKHFKKRMTSKAAELVAKLRHDKIYPYQDDPTNEVEKAERQVFDICAVKIYQSLPSFQNTDRRQKEFTLALIKQAIESSSSNLSTILQKVLELSDDE